MRFVLTDGDGGTSNAAEKSISVTPVDDPPVANPDSYTVAEDNTLTIDGTSWWDGNWDYRARLTFQNATRAKTSWNFPSWWPSTPLGSARCSTPRAWPTAATCGSSIPTARSWPTRSKPGTPAGRPMSGSRCRGSTLRPTAITSGCTGAMPAPLTGRMRRRCGATATRASGTWTAMPWTAAPTATTEPTPAAAAATGAIGGARDFDGISDYISIPSTTSLTPTSAITLEGWIQLRTFGAGSDVDTIIRKGEVNPQNYELVIHDQNPHLALDANDGSGLSGALLLAANAWYYVTGTWDGATQQVYLNGVLDGTAAHAAPWEPTRGTCSWAAGPVPTTATEYWTRLAFRRWPLRGLDRRPIRLDERRPDRGGRRRVPPQPAGRAGQRR